MGGRSGPEYAAVLELSAKFVCVKINADKNKALAQKLGVSGYPTIVFLNSSGKETDRIRATCRAAHSPLI